MTILAIIGGAVLAAAIIVGAVQIARHILEPSRKGNRRGKN